VSLLGAYGALRIDDLSSFYWWASLAWTAACARYLACCRLPFWRARGYSQPDLPAANAAEAAVVEGVNVYPVSSLTDVLDLLNSSVVGAIQREPCRVATETLLGELQHFAVDFKDVRGQQTAKRALEVAAAGSHNILMIGRRGRARRCWPSDCRRSWRR